MRRLPVLAALLALLLVAAPAIAAPATEAAHVLAAEAGEPLGPNPSERTSEDNAATTLSGYEDRDLPFTWGAAWILTFAGLVGLVLLAGLYQLLVRGPQQGKARQQARN